MKSRSERLQISTETKLQCIQHELGDDIGTKVLFRMLDKYVEDGTTYIDKEIKLAKRYDMPRYYFVNLYNDPARRDVVLIRTQK